MHWRIFSSSSRTLFSIASKKEGILRLFDTFSCKFITRNATQRKKEKKLKWNFICFCSLSVCAAPSNFTILDPTTHHHSNELKKKKKKEINVDKIKRRIDKIYALEWLTFNDLMVAISQFLNISKQVRTRRANSDRMRRKWDRDRRENQKRRHKWNDNQRV